MNKVKFFVIALIAVLFHPLIFIASPGADKKVTVRSSAVPLEQEGDITLFFTGEVNGSFEPCG